MGIFDNLLNPNRDQVISLLGSMAKWTGAALATRGITVSPDMASILAGPEALQFYAGIILGAIPLFRDWFIHSTAGKLSAASAIKGMELPLKVLPSAPPDVKAVANDPKVPNVQLAIPLQTIRNSRAY